MAKETVVRRRGADWSFHLPKMHSIEVDRENRRFYVVKGSVAISRRHR